MAISARARLERARLLRERCETERELYHDDKDPKRLEYMRAGSLMAAVDVLIVLAERRGE